MKKKTKIIIAYLTLTFVISILLMSLWICIKNVELPKIILYIGTGILYLATFAGLLRGIIWTIEHFVKWINDEEYNNEM
jgi:hypothetical protein